MVAAAAAVVVVVVVVVVVSMLTDVPEPTGHVCTRAASDPAMAAYIHARARGLVPLEQTRSYQRKLIRNLALVVVVVVVVVAAVVVVVVAALLMTCSMQRTSDMHRSNVDDDSSVGIIRMCRWNRRLWRRSLQKQHHKKTTALDK